MEANFLPVPAVGILFFLFYAFVSTVYWMETFYLFFVQFPHSITFPIVMNEVIKILDECTS